MTPGSDIANRLTPANIRNYRIKLASNSPRRKELLKLLGLDFDVVTTHAIDEHCPDNIPPERMPEYLSIQKAAAYFSEMQPDELLITADTMVICDGKPLGKPGSADEACQMLRTLSGKTHKVITGVTVCSCQLQVSFSVTTHVDFCEISDEEIGTYVATFNPLDKAGAYGIQEWIGAIGIKGINGSFYNVMGLPVHYLYKVLKHFNTSDLLAIGSTARTPGAQIDDPLV